MQAGSGDNIGRVEKQLGLNLQVGGGILKLYRDIGLLMSNGFYLLKMEHTNLTRDITLWFRHVPMKLKIILQASLMQFD